VVNEAVHPGYTTPRPEVAALVPASATRVLDVGCRTGAMGALLREAGHDVTGIELDPVLAAQARRRLDRVVEADIETLARDRTDPGGPFDCIVFADVLEHLRDPWSVVRWADGLLGAGGTVVVSIPNIRHVTTFWHLAVRRRWPREEMGLFDRTHIRFFTRKDLPGLFDGTSVTIEQIRRVFMFSPYRTRRVNRWSRLFGDLGALQFLVRARRSERA
jgi:2-polyprenyl-3-methyl-5-hydroxy-6-metoxy-1,4-benzoquinol methylase